MTIGTPKIDFQIINSNDPKILMIADFSEWFHIESKPAVISITMPGSKYPVQHNFVKNNLNGFNSNTLGMTCDVGCDDPKYSDLPDGIYKICVEGSPNTFKKIRYYLKTDRTSLDLDKQMVKLGIEYNLSDKEYREHLETIDFLLRVARAATRLGEIPKGSQHFEHAIKLLEKYRECKNCI